MYNFLSSAVGQSGGIYVFLFDLFFLSSLCLSLLRSVQPCLNGTYNISMTEVQIVVNTVCCRLRDILILFVCSSPFYFLSVVFSLLLVISVLRPFFCFYSCYLRQLRLWNPLENLFEAYLAPNFASNEKQAHQWRWTEILAAFTSICYRPLWITC